MRHLLAASLFLACSVVVAGAGCPAEASTRPSYTTASQCHVVTIAGGKSLGSVCLQATSKKAFTPAYINLHFKRTYEVRLSKQKGFSAPEKVLIRAQISAERAIYIDDVFSKPLLRFPSLSAFENKARALLRATDSAVTEFDETDWAPRTRRLWMARDATATKDLVLKALKADPAADPTSAGVVYSGVQPGEVTVTGDATHWIVRASNTLDGSAVTYDSVTGAFTGID